MVPKWLTKENINNLPRKTGVYFLAADKKILYIGKAMDIQNRVRNHFQEPNHNTQAYFRDALFSGKVTRIGYIITNSEIEALLLESKLIKRYQPKYNVIWKDDKKYFYVAIASSVTLKASKEKLPRIFLTHQPDDTLKLKTKDEKLTTYFMGPFVDGLALKRTLRLLRRVFPYYIQKTHPLMPCQWCHLNLCPGPNPNPKKYRRNIKNIVEILRGKETSTLEHLRQEMKDTAKRQDYERAAEIRNQLFSLERTLANARIIENGEDIAATWTKTQKMLQELFATKRKIYRLEACDIANIQGQEATGSIVTFINGRPDKNFYRKFKIKISGKPNDTAMIKETIMRRLRHKDWGMPDILLIDGGRGQLNAAIEAKNEKLKTGNIKIIALAKKENKLYLGGREPILLKNLPQEVSNLILHLRDEAHRFARVYHHHLRSKTFKSLQ